MRALLCRELIGREQALEAARTALDDAARGSGGVLFVSGEAGVGKSRLVSELVDEARGAGMRVLFGRAVQADVPVPFRPFSEALLSHFRSQGLPDLPELEPFRPALGRLLPEWRTPGEITHEPLVVLAEGLVRLLTAAADPRGLLLVLEDMHWADQESLAVLEYFADVLRTQPVLCVATVRSEEASPALRLTQGLKAARTATVLELDALAPDDLSRMTAACLDSVSVPAGVVEYVRTWSDGLPFMVEEVLAGAVGAGALAWDGQRWSFDTEAGPSLPVSFVDNVRGRLRGLGPEAARVLRVAAVVGRRFDWTLLPAAAELPDLEVMTALRAGSGDADQRRGRQLRARRRRQHRAGRLRQHWRARPRDAQAPPRRHHVHSSGHHVGHRPGRQPARPGPGQGRAAAQEVALHHSLTLPGCGGPGLDQT